MAPPLLPITPADLPPSGTRSSAPLVTLADLERLTEAAFSPAGMLAMAIVLLLIAGAVRSSDCSRPSYDYTSDTNYRYSYTRFRQEGFTRSDADAGAKEVTNSVRNNPDDHFQ